MIFDEANPFIGTWLHTSVGPIDSGEEISYTEQYIFTEDMTVYLYSSLTYKERDEEPLITSGTGTYVFDETTIEIMIDNVVKNTWEQKRDSYNINATYVLSGNKLTMTLYNRLVLLYYKQ
jgi:hypothetical protein